MDKKTTIWIRNIQFLEKCLLRIVFKKHAIGSHWKVFTLKNCMIVNKHVNWQSSLNIENESKNNQKVQFKVENAAAESTFRGTG
jgi:hypothetical protein